MGKHHSTTSADNKFKININNCFVPVIIMVVLCILIVATFSDKEPGSQLAGDADTQQTSPAAYTTAVTGIHPEASEVADASLKSMHTAAIADQSMPRDQAVATQTEDDEDIADAEVMSPAQRSTTADIDGAVANLARHTAPTGKPATDQNAPDRDDPAASGSGRHLPAVDRRQVTHTRPYQRHRLYQQARQAQQAHRMKMLEYRAEVMKRIEQDRRDLYRYGHDSAQQQREHRDRYRNKLAPARIGAEDMPI